MILREATIRFAGYDPNSLSHGSAKKICCSCDNPNCKNPIRWIGFKDYRDLCKSCSYYTDKYKNKMCGNNNPFHGKCGKDTAMYGKKYTLKSKIKSSCTKQGIKIENWNGFLSNGKYCSKFNNQLKQLIRNRYNNCDYISGLSQKYFNRKLDVHHIDYDKEQGCNGKKFNLIPLCQSNHVKTNSNRIFWNQLFKYSLEIDKWYYDDNLINIWKMI